MGLDEGERTLIGGGRVPATALREVHVGQGDLDDASVQSIYAVREPLADTGWGNFRAAAGVVQQVITASGATRTITEESVDWTTGPGWFVDLSAEAGERINVDFKIVSGVLTAVTVPDTGL